MKILEKFIKGKKNKPSLCEDGIFTSENFIAVVDGVTSKEIDANKKTGGRAAMEKIIQVLSVIPKDIDKNEVFQSLSNAVATLYDEGYSSAAACTAIFSRAKNEIWLCGDCQCIVNGTYYENEKQVDKIVSDMRALVIEIAKLEGRTEEEIAENDLGREFVLPIITKQKLLYNNKNSVFGFEVLNGKDLFFERIKTIKVKNGDMIVLASDGYPVLCNTLEESEEMLNKIIKENPLCYKKEYRSTKGVLPGANSFDDRSYIKFII